MMKAKKTNAIAGASRGSCPSSRASFPRPAGSDPLKSQAGVSTSRMAGLSWAVKSLQNGAARFHSFGGSANRTPPNYRASAFSLIELLMVMGIMAIMMTLLLPSIAGFSSTSGRRGAVIILMNAFEQARVAALEAGRPVYVVFRRRPFPESDAIMVFRETEDGTGLYEQMTKWIRMPKGILLHQPNAGNSLLSTNLVASSVFDVNRVPNPPLLAAGDETLKLLAFNESGGIAFPSSNDKTYRKLIVSEGVRGTGGTEALISSKKQAAGGFEIISLSRYTGRSQLDITTIP